MIPAYIGPGPGFAVQAPGLAVLLGFVAALLALLTFPIRWLLRRPLPRGAASARRVVVVGLDGLSPELTERWLQEGMLPNLKALADSGSYQRMATTCPPLSPVAWSSFATGVNPGKHGIFGFLHRTRDFRPFLAFSQVQDKRPKFLRKSVSFWKILGDHGVFSHVLRVPVTWPPESFHGVLLSAMGVPDLRGTQGTYTLFAPEKLTKETVVWEQSEETCRARVPGGPELRLQGRRLDCQGWSLELRPGRHSEWKRLRRDDGSRGLVRFVLLDDGRLYMTPMHIDPERPALPISSPGYFSIALSKLLGPFATCGLAEDTTAYEDGVLGEEQFLEQAYAIHEEREKQLFHALERTQDGLCLTVFDGPDRIQHMAWRNEEAMRELYVRMDRLVGRVQSRLKEGDVLLVMSDHGFQGLERTVDLNRWLVEQGYLVPGDWSRTRVYGLGLAGLHLSVKSRDTHGVVTEPDALMDELCQRLSELTDPVTGRKPIQKVYRARDIYRGPYLEHAPDLVIGYAAGYRISKRSARGEVGGDVFEHNDSTWCADHCLDPELVPGVLFCNRKLDGGADIRDLAPTILHWFGVAAPEHIEGKCLAV